MPKATRKSKPRLNPALSRLLKQRDSREPVTVLTDVLPAGVYGELEAALKTIAELKKVNSEQLARLVEQDLKIGRMGANLEATRAELATLKAKDVPEAPAAEVTR